MKNLTHLSVIFVVLVLLVLSLMLISCSKEEGPEPPITGWRMCFEEMSWDANRVRDSLVGKWHYEFVHCNGSDEGVYVTDQNFIVEFRDDSTVVTTRHDTILQESKWWVIPFGPGYRIETKEFVEGIFFRLYLCQDYLIFSARESDVCDEYYRKIE